MRSEGIIVTRSDHRLPCSPLICVGLIGSQIPNIYVREWIVFLTTTCTSVSIVLPNNQVTSTRTCRVTICLSCISSHWLVVYTILITSQVIDIEIWLKGCTLLIESTDIDTDSSGISSSCAALLYSKRLPRGCLLVPHTPTACCVKLQVPCRV